MRRKIFFPPADNNNSVRSAQSAVPVLTGLSPLTVSVEHKVTDHIADVTNVYLACGLIKIYNVKMEPKISGSLSPQYGVMLGYG
jgi:hypothetical protein